MKKIPQSFFSKHLRAGLALLSVAFFMPLCAQQPLQGYGLLWEISGNGMAQPSYLYGSIHIRHKDVFDFPDSLFLFMEQCDAFASEVELDSSMVLLFSSIFSEHQEFDRGQRSIAPARGSSLPQVQRAYQPPRRKLEPVMYTMLDAYLHGVARSQGKCIYGLENIREHMQLENMTGSMTDRLPWEFGIGQKEEGVEDIRAIYLSGKLDSIYSYVLQYGGSSEYEDLVRRNHIMLASMKAIMQSQSLFTVVGAAHLPGEGGLVSLLQQAGYSLRQVVPTYTGLTQTYSYLPVEENWFRYSSSDSLLVFDAPVDMVSIGRRSANQYWTGLDLGTGIGYNVAAVFRLPGKYIDWQQQFFDPEVYTLLREQTIVHQGQQGKEFWLLRSNDDLKYFRARLFEVNGRLYFIQLAAFAEEKLRAESGLRFLESLQLPTAAPAVVTTTVPQLNCQFLFPGSFHRQEVTTATGEKSLLMRACDAAGNYYAFRSAIVAAGLSDSMLLTRMAAYEFDYFQLPDNRPGLVLDSLALTASATVVLSESASLRLKIFREGSRLYMLAAAGENASQAFLNSFQWLPARFAGGEREVLAGVADSVYWPVGGIVSAEKSGWMDNLAQLLPITRQSYQERTDPWTGTSLGVLAAEIAPFARVESYEASFTTLLTLIRQSAVVKSVSPQPIPNGLKATCEWLLPDGSTVQRLSLHWEGQSFMVKIAEGSSINTRHESIDQFLAQQLRPADTNLLSQNLVLQKVEAVLDAWLSADSGWSDTREALLCNYPFIPQDAAAIAEALQPRHWLEGHFTANLLRIRLVEVLACLDEPRSLQLLQQLWMQPGLRSTYAADYLLQLAVMNSPEAGTVLAGHLQQMDQPNRLWLWRYICKQRPELFFRHIALWEEVFAADYPLVFWQMAARSLDTGASITAGTQALWLEKVQKGLDYKQDTAVTAAVITFIDKHPAEIPGVNEAVSIFWKKPIAAALSVQAAHYLLRRKQTLHPDKISKLLADSTTFLPLIAALNEHNGLEKLDKGISTIDIAKARLLAAVPAGRWLRASPVFFKSVVYRSEGHKYKAYVFRLPLAAGEGFGLAAVGGFDLRGKRQGWAENAEILFNWKEVSLLQAATAAQLMLGSGSEKPAVSPGGG
jgi:uncharacterized protein YbaP (TraB family)